MYQPAYSTKKMNSREENTLQLAEMIACTLKWDYVSLEDAGVDFGNSGDGSGNEGRGLRGANVSRWVGAQSMTPFLISLQNVTVISERNRRD
jgi:hypothetical protein